MHHYEIKRGLIVVDDEKDDIGKVVEVHDNIVTLKSLHPDRMEWEADARRLRLATPVERMKAKVAAENYASVNRPR